MGKILSYLKNLIFKYSRRIYFFGDQISEVDKDLLARTNHNLRKDSDKIESFHGMLIELPPDGEPIKKRDTK